MGIYRVLVGDIFLVCLEGKDQLARSRSAGLNTGKKTAVWKCKIILILKNYLPTLISMQLAKKSDTYMSYRFQIINTI